MADAPAAPGPKQGGNPAQGLGRRMAAMPGGNRFWIILLVLLAVNYIIASQASSGPERSSPITESRGCWAAAEWESSTKPKIST